MNLSCLFCPPHREPSADAKNKDGAFALFSNDSNGTKNTYRNSNNSFDCYVDDEDDDNDDEYGRDPSIPREIEARAGGGGNPGRLERSSDRSLYLSAMSDHPASNICEGRTKKNHPAGDFTCEANGDLFWDSHVSLTDCCPARQHEPLPTVPARPAARVRSYDGGDGGGGSDRADADDDEGEDRFADENCWSEPDASSFQVRGSNYLVDRVKVSNRGPAHFRARGVDIFRVAGAGPLRAGGGGGDGEDEAGEGEEGDGGKVDVVEEPPTKNVAMNPNLLGGRLRDVPTFVVNFRFGWGCAVIYFEVPEKFRPFLRPAFRGRRRPRRGSASGPCSICENDESDGRCGGGPSRDDGEEDIDVVDDEYDGDNEDAEIPSMEHMHTPGERLLCQFLLGGTAERNRKLKMIPVVVDGPWAVQRVVGGKPVIIGNKVPVRYSYGPADPDAGLAEYLEADLDIDVGGRSSRFMVTQITSFCLAYTRNFTMDFAFVVQGDDDDELPEHVLGAVRLQRINYLEAPIFPDPASSAVTPHDSRAGDDAPASGGTEQEGEIFWDCDEYSLGESLG